MIQNILNKERRVLKFGEKFILMKLKEINLS